MKSFYLPSLCFAFVLLLSCKPVKVVQIPFAPPQNILVAQVELKETPKAELSLRENIWIGSANYVPAYVGKYCDTIYNCLVKNSNKQFVIDERRVKYKIAADSNRVKITVDTSRFFKESFSEWDPQIEKTLLKEYKSYPVKLENIISDTLAMGFIFHVQMVTEAKGPDGKWKAIEEPYEYRTGVGFGPNRYLLAPGEMVLTSVPVYKGTYKTKLRLRFGTIVSDEFNGSINLTQFMSRYDEYGQVRAVK